MKVEWLTGLFTLLGMALGAGITEFRHWRERRERYQVMTFEKRLQAHQQAFSWCMNVHGILKRMTIVQELERVEELGRKFVEVTDKATDWWAHNCLYLDDHSKLRFLKMINMTGQQVNEILDKSVKEAQTKKAHASVQISEDVRAEIKKTLTCLVEGIGAKYLPEIEEELESSEQS